MQKIKCKGEMLWGTQNDTDPVSILHLQTQTTSRNNVTMPKENFFNWFSYTPVSLLIHTFINKLFFAIPTPNYNKIYQNFIDNLNY